MAAAMSEGFAVSISRVDDRMVVVVRGEIDVATAPSLASAFADLASAGTPADVVDLRHVTFCDSSGLSALIAAHQSLPPGQPLTLLRPTRTVRRLLTLTGMTGTFRVED